MKETLFVYHVINDPYFVNHASGTDSPEPLFHAINITVSRASLFIFEGNRRRGQIR